MLRFQNGGPGLSLDRFVESIRVVEAGAGLARHEILPDGRTTLVFRSLAAGLSGDVAVAGPRTRALFKSVAGIARAIVVRFKPGWSAPLLGVAANELTDRVVSLQELWGPSGRELHDELLEAETTPAALERLARALSRRAERAYEPASAPLARRAVRLLDAGEGRVDRVAERLGVTARHLRRAFTESVGIGPKEYARAIRLQRALQLARGSTDWVRIAVDAGYYDQAHLIGDFRSLVGLTPSAFARRAATEVHRSNSVQHAPNST